MKNVCLNCFYFEQNGWDAGYCLHPKKLLVAELNTDDFFSDIFENKIDNYFVHEVNYQPIQRLLAPLLKKVKGKKESEIIEGFIDSLQDFIKDDILFLHEQIIKKAGKNIDGNVKIMVASEFCCDYFS